MLRFPLKQLFFPYGYNRRIPWEKISAFRALFLRRMQILLHQARLVDGERSGHGD
jgi:hypothetical protein